VDDRFHRTGIGGPLMSSYIDQCKIMPTSHIVTNSGTVARYKARRHNADRSSQP
jgi:hypothetical protein